MSVIFQKLVVLRQNLTLLEKPANAEFAKIIQKNWESKKRNDDMKSIFEKNKSPENCVFETFKVNLEVLKLLNSWQQKSDIKFMSIQKSLVRTMNASLKIFCEIHSGDFSVQSIAQKTADIATILGQASHELCLKRRVFIRSVINSEYKDLYSSSQPVTEFFFGDNLSQVVKDMNLANKLGSRPINKLSHSRNTGYAGNKGYYKQNSFLGRGRSNPNHEP